MKTHRQLILTTALALTAAVSAGVALIPASQQTPAKPAAQPPAEPPAQQMPPMPPAPGEHHKWLEQLVGEWTVEGEMTAPSMDPIKCAGTDSVRSLGGRWIVCELKNDMPGMGTMNAVWTIGYDSEKHKYQGAWVDSVQDHMWIHSGTLDATGKILTLEAEGPNMMDPAGGAGLTKFRDVIEIKSADHRTLTSSALDADGKWVQFGVSHYRRVK